MRNGPVAVTSRWQQIQHPEESHIHASSGIRTRDPNKRVAALDRAATRSAESLLITNYDKEAFHCSLRDFFFLLTIGQIKVNFGC